MILDNCLCSDGYRSIYGSDAVNEHFYSFFAEKFNANIGKRLRSDTASWNESTGEGAVINTVRTTGWASCFQKRKLCAQRLSGNHRKLRSAHIWIRSVVSVAGANL